MESKKINEPEKEKKSERKNRDTLKLIGTQHTERKKKKVEKGSLIDVRLIYCTIKWP